MKKDQKKRQAGGLKGFFERAGHSFWSGGEFLAETGTYLAGWAGKLGFIVATTAMVVFMPLVFELGREPLMIEAERAQVKDLRNRGYSDRQLQEMGFAEISIHSPSVPLNK